MSTVRIVRKKFSFHFLIFIIGLYSFHSIAQDKTVRIVQITDPQFGFFDENSGFEKETIQYSEAISQINKLKPDFVVITGDFVNNSRDLNQIEEFKRITAGLNNEIPFYLSPGNHDLGQNPVKEDFDIYFSHYGEGNDRFAFEYNNSYFIGLNSVIIKSGTNKKEEREQFRWLKKRLKKAKSSDVIIVFTHYPFFINDFEEDITYSNQSKEERLKYFTLFEKYGVDAIFSGHLHNNAEAEHNGILMITTNSAGRPLGKAEPGYRLIELKDGIINTKYINLNP
ncbi:metallophosphoesterase [Lascolabacillus massiliensis]|jgi:3',5'-cyclic AMP phosphodiesterase CpdA|uniref:metallophosphoesterase n=1 Tax=Lascolabacillus massiliensis TaxID=1627894 RepID=UPI0006B341FE|nr:metallophosphoesterase [Lascolabacillus massiliensis]MCK9501285.1 metallophosphoesterase [Lascolabacillus sp.]